MSVILRLDNGGGRVSLPLKRRSHVRDRITAEIERLVDMLDALDGDADAEPGLGWPEGQIPNRYEFGSADDREDDAGDDREPDEDREPILGWTSHQDQADPIRFGEAWRHDEDEHARQPANMHPSR